MLVKVHRDDPSSPSKMRFENMAVTRQPVMALLLTDVTYPTKDSPEGSIHVTYVGPKTEQSNSITIPLEPSTADLPLVDVELHFSPTSAYNMGEYYNTWFSTYFGFEVMLTYLGEHSRPVLFPDSRSNASSSWLSSITNQIPYLGTKPEEDRISFADCAPFLVVSETSLADVSSRLPDGEEFDMTKFRPNIVVTGADKAWEEDYWADLDVGDGLLIHLKHNCGRCQSINIDYATGLPGAGPAGTMLKKLQKDRRIDKGVKYTPVFGRYGFLRSQEGTITVGNEVAVKQRNTEPTVFGKNVTLHPKYLLLTARNRLAWFSELREALTRPPASSSDSRVTGLLLQLEG